MTLCGDPPTRLRGCDACQDRLAALRRVHVQSSRKPAEGMCGIRLGIAPQGAARDALGSPAVTSAVPRIAPAYVTVEQARSLLASPTGVEVCPGCAGNLARRDDALGRRTRRMAGYDEPSEPRAVPAVDPADAVQVDHADPPAGREL